MLRVLGPFDDDFREGKSGQLAGLLGFEGDDAKQYQEKAVRKAIEESRR